MNLSSKVGEYLASIIIPVYRDWDDAAALLLELRGQARPDCQVILVDNDPDRENVPNDLPDPEMHCQIVPCTAPGSYAARNAGAQKAAGELLIFTDADCRPQPGWLDAHLNVERHEPVLSAGPVIVEPGPELNNWAIFDTVRGMRQEVFVRHGYAVTANLAVPRSVFEHLDGFDAKRLSGGDAEFCRRAVRAGFPLTLESSAVVLHPARNSWMGLATKARRIKGGQVTSGSAARRIVWFLRSLTPPVREMLAYVTSSYPFRWRLIACCVRLRLWFVEIKEVMNLLLFQKTVERR
ncbi:glycosyltransferase [Sulfitobacter sp. R18_2]|uniref:glycosyltransferase family 2 protein n=1 Tax=Sulfitobacter sp. R18_2 TaxID=2821105 RepID=UPI001AD9958D|nr:glycosyltransferase [Sulfitobacter sp. R18_2]